MAEWLETQSGDANCSVVESATTAVETAAAAAVATGQREMTADQAVTEAAVPVAAADLETELLNTAAAAVLLAEED